MSFSITSSLFEENLDKSKFDHPKDYAMENARCKALEVMERLKAKVNINIYVRACVLD